MIQVALDEIQRQTGWVGIVLVRGPEPKRGGSNIYYCFGTQTAHLKSTFLQYHLDFEDHIAQPFAQYLQASFPADVRAKMALPTVPPLTSATVQISMDGTSFIVSSTASGSIGSTIATLASLDTDGAHVQASASSAPTVASSSSAPASATVQVTVDASTPLSLNIRATASANVTNGSMSTSAVVNVVSPLHSHAANCPDSLVTRSPSYGWSRSNSFEEERLANIARNKAALALLSNFTLPTAQLKKTCKKAAKGLPVTRNLGHLSSGQDLLNDTDNSPDSQFEAANPLAPAPVAPVPQVNVILTVIVAPVPEIVGPRTPVVQSSAPISPAPDIVNPPAVITPAPAAPMPDITALPAPIPLVLLCTHAMAPAPDVIAPPDIIAPLAQPIPALPVPSVIEVIPTAAPELDHMAKPAVCLSLSLSDDSHPLWLQKALQVVRILHGVPDSWVNLLEAFIIFESQSGYPTKRANSLL
ncbi:hypothetical protein SCP_1600590 [Sparassis crispa]|uniref:Uncharacterized protein n=1 Tax=Sparassis crispa TaxID=139825 RepID=A0A401H4P3_9APHY|nr:hypothetical protein SCP_1600590 [Sparassis crispa]GBE89398.1 hypothetical protein SCP_1600590 [Sparassis crispa]